MNSYAQKSSEVICIKRSCYLEISPDEPAMGNRHNAKEALDLFGLIESPTQKTIIEDERSFLYATLDQLSYTRYWKKSPMPLKEKVKILRIEIVNQLRPYIHAGTIKWHGNSDISVEEWITTMQRYNLSFSL